MIPLLFFIIGFALLAWLGFRYSSRVRVMVYRKRLSILQADHLDLLAQRRSYFLILIEILKKDELFRQKQEILWESMEEWKAMYYEFMQNKSDYGDLLDRALQIDTAMNQIYPFIATENMEALEVLTKLNESVNTKNRMAIEWIQRTSPEYARKFKTPEGILQSILELHNGQ